MKEFKIFNNFTKPDKILFVFLICCTLFFFQKAYLNLQKGTTVIIEINNERVGKYSLNKDRQIHVNGPIGTTLISIKNGQVGIKKSPCRNKMCIKFGMIKHAGRASVCLPNKVVVRILGGKNHSDIDAVLG